MFRHDEYQVALGFPLTDFYILKANIYASIWKSISDISYAKRSLFPDPVGPRTHWKNRPKNHPDEKSTLISI